MTTHPLTEIHHVAIRIPALDARNAAVRLQERGLKFNAVTAREDFTLLRFANTHLAILGADSRTSEHVGVSVSRDISPMGVESSHRDGSRGYYSWAGGVGLEVLTQIPPALSLNDTQTVLEIFPFDGGRPAFTLHVGTNLLSWSDSKDDPEWEQRLQAARSLVSRAGGEIRDLRKSQQ